MDDIIGSWRLRMKTPVGTITADYTFTQTPAGISGTASGTGEETPLCDIAVEPADEGERVTWRQSITRPLRLNLDFDITVTGDTLTGHSRLFRFQSALIAPRSPPEWISDRKM
jgi:hypothetical protein